MACVDGPPPGPISMRSTATDPCVSDGYKARPFQDMETFLKAPNLLLGESKPMSIADDETRVVSKQMGHSLSGRGRSTLQPAWALSSPTVSHKYSENNREVLGFGPERGRHFLESGGRMARG